LEALERADEVVDLQQVSVDRQRKRKTNLVARTMSEAASLKWQSCQMFMWTKTVDCEKHDSRGFAVDNISLEKL